jgi:hypothetical protein
LPVSAVVKPSGIGDGQAAASALDSRASVADRQMTAVPIIARVFKDKVFKDKALKDKALKNLAFKNM